jgi:hypothetical protein
VTLVSSLATPHNTLAPISILAWCLDQSGLFTTKNEGKVALMLNLIKHHAMKLYGRGEVYLHRS